MKKPSAFSSRGVSYVEILVALAVLGMCVLILAPTIAQRKYHQRHMQYHLRAVTALASEADLIRQGRPQSLGNGRHSFLQEALLLKELPRGTAQYEVSPSPLRGMARVILRVSWHDGRPQSREMQIYVRR